MVFGTVLGRAGLTCLHYYDEWPGWNSTNCKRNLASSAVKFGQMLRPAFRVEKGAFRGKPIDEYVDIN
jgi:hypothetical protein